MTFRKVRYHGRPIVVNGLENKRTVLMDKAIGVVTIKREFITAM